jgi:YfiH family protein
MDAADEALRAVDALLAAGGLSHGTRSTRPAAQVQAARPASRPAASAKAQGHAPLLLRVPAWERHPWLVHGFSTRLAGVSTAYAQGNGRGEMNLGFTPGDARENVLRNREIFLRALVGDASQPRKRPLPALVLLRQVHSGIVYRTEETDGRNDMDAPTEALRAGDGIMTALPDRLLAIQTADCLPVLVVDLRQRVVAAFHAGWRGTVARIVERGVGRMRAEFGSRPADLTASIGPGIGGCCYAVGEELRSEFASQFAYSEALFHEVYDLDPIKEKYPLLFLTARAPGHSNLGPSIHLDLVEANRRQLLDAGVAPGKIHALEMCTACHTGQFFSHRAEQGFTGRMMAAIGLRPS